MVPLLTHLHLVSGILTAGGGGRHSRRTSRRTTCSKTGVASGEYRYSGEPRQYSGKQEENLREESQHLRNRVEILEETVETIVEIRQQKEIQRLNGLIIGEDGLLTDEREAFVEDEALIDHPLTTVAQQDDLEPLR